MCIQFFHKLIKVKQYVQIRIGQEKNYIQFSQKNREKIRLTGELQ